MRFVPVEPPVGGAYAWPGTISGLTLRFCRKRTAAPLPCLLLVVQSSLSGLAQVSFESSRRPMPGRHYLQRGQLDTPAVSACTVCVRENHEWSKKKWVLSRRPTVTDTEDLVRLLRLPAALPAPLARSLSLRLLLLLPNLFFCPGPKAARAGLSLHTYALGTHSLHSTTPHPVLNGG